MWATDLKTGLKDSMAMRYWPHCVLYVLRVMIPREHYAVEVTSKTIDTQRWDLLLGKGSEHEGLSGGKEQQRR